jgi:hypothetical protein
MKIGKVWLNVLMVSVVLVCFGLSTVHAQEYPDLSRWKYQWFSITASASGWEIEKESTTILTSKESTKAFLKLGALDTDSLEAFLWGPNLDETWVLVATGSCDYVRGNDLDFICELYGDGTGDGTSSFNAAFQTFIRITGKLDTKTQLLKSATLKSSGGVLAGYVNEESPDTLTVGGITFTGKWLNMTTFCKGSSNLSTPPCTSP